MELVRPGGEHLPSYVDALRRGWSADNLRGAAAAREELARIEQDAEAFLASLRDVEARGRDITLPDGTSARRIPGFTKWMWDGEFCGSIGLRWVPGTDSLPPHVLGHVGYAVVPWKQGRGYATQALGAMLPEARTVGLHFIDMTTDPANFASQRVMQSNGARLVQRFRKPDAYGAAEGLLFRIDLQGCA